MHLGLWKTIFMRSAEISSQGSTHGCSCSCCCSSSSNCSCSSTGHVSCCNSCQDLLVQHCSSTSRCILHNTCLLCIVIDTHHQSSYSFTFNLKIIAPAPAAAADGALLPCLCSRFWHNEERDSCSPHQLTIFMHQSVLISSSHMPAGQHC